MEPRHRERLSELVEELTTSGRAELPPERVKELKNICRLSPECVEHVFRSLLSQLNQDHAEIRLSSFQVCRELFTRSHHFRTLLVHNFQEFLELTVETDSEKPLPPPKEAGRRLRSLAIQSVHSWHSSYGSSYKKLALGYHFLKQVKKVDFQDAEARTVSERRRHEERLRRMENIYRDRVEAAAREMEESAQEIEATLTEMDSCMKLLLPDLLTADQSGCSREEQEEQGEQEEEGEQEEQEQEEEEEEHEQFIRTSGLVSHSYSLDLKLSPELHIKETEDNEAVVATVIDLHKLITTKHLPAVQRWTQVFSRSGAEQQLLRRSLDLKQSLEAALQKHKELNIDYRRRATPKAGGGAEEEEEEEEEFEEVPEKEGYEPHIPEHLRAEYGLEPAPSTSSAPIPPRAVAPPPPPPPSPSCSSSSSRRLRRQMEEEQDPTCAAATLRLLRSRCSAPPPECSAPAAPTPSEHNPVGAPLVPFGLDLYYWGEEPPNAGKILKSASQHQFWVPCEVEEEVQSEELLALSKTRSISFPGTFTPVTHVCRAPLASGRLCPRQDRVKCPFHGPIVPRDERGRVLRPEDRERDERRLREQQPDWQDVELMRDIEAATGEDLGSERVARNKGKKKKKKKYPQLTDLKQSANTSRSRLERKVFNKSSVRRVAEVMNKSDRRKHDKFSNQFNYALH